jgi:DNA-binding MarR family transcriptional regulator
LNDRSQRAGLLTPAETAAWRAYIEASLLLNTRIDEDLRATHGLTLFDYHVLVLLAETPAGRLRMRDLAARLVFAPSRLTYQAARMERMGLIAREACEDDRRGSFAVLTPGGRDALRRASTAHAESIRRNLLNLLDDRDVECLGQVFNRIRCHLAADPGASASEPAPTT